MKLKLPQQLLLALLASFIITPAYAANVALNQSDATAKKWYQSGTENGLNNKPLGQTNFTLGEDVTFTGYTYNHEHSKLETSPGVTQDYSSSWGNAFRFTLDLRESYDADTLKGDTAKTYSLSFVNNISNNNTPHALDKYAQSYGGAAYFYRLYLI